MVPAARSTVVQCGGAAQVSGGEPRANMAFRKPETLWAKWCAPELLLGAKNSPVQEAATEVA